MLPPPSPYNLSPLLTDPKQAAIYQIINSKENSILNYLVTHFGNHGFSLYLEDYARFESSPNMEEGFFVNATWAKCPYCPHNCGHPDITMVFRCEERLDGFSFCNYRYPVSPPNQDWPSWLVTSHARPYHLHTDFRLHLKGMSLKLEMDEYLRDKRYAEWDRYIGHTPHSHLRTLLQEAYLNDMFMTVYRDAKKVEDWVGLYNLLQYPTLGSSKACIILQPNPESCSREQPSLDIHLNSANDIVSLRLGRPFLPSAKELQSTSNSPHPVYDQPFIHYQGYTPWSDPSNVC